MSPELAPIISRAITWKRTLYSYNGENDRDKINLTKKTR